MTLTHTARTTRVWHRAAIALACAMATSGCDRFTSPPPTTIAPDQVTPNATVNYVIDGDTIIATIDGAEEHIRLIGIDTPEIAHPERGQTADCFGPEASQYTETLLPVGTEVQLQRDVEGRDDYDRILAYVYRASDGIFVNYEIVRHGFARPLSIYPNDTFAELFADAASDAHAEDLGLWASC